MYEILKRQWQIQGVRCLPPPPQASGALGKTFMQLKQTFEKTDLDKLQNLYFDFDMNEELDTDLDSQIELEDEQDGQESTATELV